jgi:hypothetical protein
MSRCFYREEFNQIVVEVTDTYVLSDLWDFSERLPLASIQRMEVVRERHGLRTLVTPALALLLAGLFALTLLRSHHLSWFLRITGPILVLVFFGNGVAGLLKYHRNRRNRLFVTTRDGRNGVLYFSQDDETFSGFVVALLDALEATRGESPPLEGAADSVIEGRRSLGNKEP